MGCCNKIYYCVNGDVVTQDAGTAAPAGYTGGPYFTLKDLADGGCEKGFCGFSAPPAVYFAFYNVTGALAGVLPNSLISQRQPLTAQLSYYSVSELLISGSCYIYLNFSTYCDSPSATQYSKTLTMYTSDGGGTCGSPLFSGSSADWTISPNNNYYITFLQSLNKTQPFLPTPALVGSVSCNIFGAASTFDLTISR